MASIINATTSTGLVSSADNSGELQLQTNSGTTAVTIDTSQNVTFAKPITVGGNTLGAGNATSFKNRIINGAMVIDQRNAGASVTPTDGQYTLDRWQATLSVASKFSVQQDAGSVTPPVGFNDYLGVTSLSAYTVGAAENFRIQQSIEGFNIADLGWGTANAKTVTLSFWVRSSLTGTFGGVLRSSNADRTYPFSYTISAANTWEQKSVTIAGDTTGAWLTNNGIGVTLRFSLGAGATLSGTAGAWVTGNLVSVTGATSVVGTNGATFYITGVQLEVGSTATSFDYRPYGTELALCQRYYYRTALLATGVIAVFAFADSTTTFGAFGNFPVRLRTNPSALEQSGTASNYSWNGVSGITCSAVPTFSGRTTADIWQVNGTVSSGLTAGQGGSFVTAGGAGYLGWSAEL